MEFTSFTCRLYKAAHEIIFLNNVEPQWPNCPCHSETLLSLEDIAKQYILSGWIAIRYKPLATANVTSTTLLLCIKTKAPQLYTLMVGHSNNGKYLYCPCKEEDEPLDEQYSYLAAIGSLL